MSAPAPGDGSSEATQPTSPPEPSPVLAIIDADPGIDDSIGIVYALSTPQIQVHSFTTVFGNVDIDRSTRNTIALTELCGAKVPVAPGTAAPLFVPKNTAPSFVHGTEGFGDARLPPMTRTALSESAVDHLLRVSAAAPGKMTLVTLGPLTNLAAALERDPAIARNVARVVVMGGSLRAGGNITQFAEANVWQDAHAANRVFAAEWPVEMIGLDVTRKVKCTREDFARIAATGKKGEFLRDAVEFYFRFYEEERGTDNVVYLHDPTAMISVHATEIFSYEEVPVRVVLDGERVGETVVSEESGRPKVKVATGVDADAVRKLWLTGLGVKEEA